MGEIAVRGGGATLGEMLERRRLEIRIHRVQRVIGALQDRHRARGRHGAAPSALGQTIEDFAYELAELRRRLNGLKHA
jgi:hypothetical protein